MCHTHSHFERVAASPNYFTMLGIVLQRNYNIFDRMVNCTCSLPLQCMHVVCHEQLFRLQLCAGGARIAINSWIMSRRAFSTLDSWITSWTEIHNEQRGYVLLSNSCHFSRSDGWVCERERDTMEMNFTEYTYEYNQFVRASSHTNKASATKWHIQDILPISIKNAKIPFHRVFSAFIRRTGSALHSHSRDHTSWAEQWTWTEFS